MIDHCGNADPHMVNGEKDSEDENDAKRIQLNYSSNPMKRHPHPEVPGCSRS